MTVLDSKQVAALDKGSLTIIIAQEQCGQLARNSRSSDRLLPFDNNLAIQDTSVGQPFDLSVIGGQPEQLSCRVLDESV
jgi:hypothetical protein